MNITKMVILAKQPIDSVQSPSNSNTIIYRPQKNSTQLHMEKKNSRQRKEFCTIKEHLEVSLSLTSRSTIEP